MKKLLKDVINRAGNRGLVLFEAPTGIGKTRAAVNYIKENIENNSGKKIIYITNLKKNLPEKELKETLKDNYDKHILFLKPYAEILIENWNKVEINNKEVKSSNQFKQINEDIKDFKEFQTKKQVDKKIIMHWLQKITEESEPEFRKYIKKTFFEESDESDSKKILNENPWIEVLYPQVNIEKYNVLLMSTNKFFSPIDPFYRNSFLFYYDDIIDNSIIIIDEFDASKKVLLNHIIDDAVKFNVDLISLFTTIYNVLVNIDMPSKLIDGEDKLEENKKSSHVIEQNIKVFKEKYEKYKLKYLVKYDEASHKKSFLFDDGNYHKIISKKQSLKSYLMVDQNQRTNIITESNADEKNILDQFIFEIRYAINHFISGVNLLAKNYLNKMRKISKDKVSFEEAILSILSIFNLNEAEKTFIISTINSNKNKDKINPGKEKIFIEDGFSYTEIGDSKYHNFQSKIRMFLFKETPEKIIADVAAKALVVGMSATATISTVIGNYDLDYLKEKLQNKYITFNNEERNELKKIFDKTQMNESIQVKVNVHAIEEYSSIDEYNQRMLEKLTGNQDLLGKYSHLENYQMKNLLKLADVYVRFGKTKEISIISFLNALPGENKTYDSNFFKDVINEAIKHHSIERYDYVIVSSQDFDEKINEVHKKIELKKKVMLITTYQTVGTGKNIQHELYEYLEERVIKNGDMKDFESIYLQRPTNLVQNLNEYHHKDHEALAMFIFHQEYLLRSNNIVTEQFTKNIQNAFKNVFYNNNFKIKLASKDTPYHTAQIIIQAVGRICRTRNHNKVTNIYIDKEVIETLQKIEKYLNNQLLHYKFKEILKTDTDTIYENLDAFNQKNNECQDKINHLSRTLKGNPDNVKRWIDTREYVLKNPTANQVPTEYEYLYYDFDIPVSSYSFNYNHKLEIINLLINSKINNNLISEEECGLNQMINNKEVEEHFISMNYATKFKPNRYIMLPSAYKKIYKGALGEVVGKFLVEEILGDKLSELKVDEFETYDYKYRKKYIDFKNWQNFDVEFEEYLKKLENKNRKHFVSKVLVINILKTGNYNFNVTQDDKIIRIPYILDENNQIPEKVEKIVFSLLTSIE